jgi:glycosyltransferase involved in cell wall biosynthesis
MKILQVSPRYYPYFGGIEEHVRSISERLAERHEIMVATTDPSGKLPIEETINNVKIMRFRSWAPDGSYYFSRKLKKSLMKNSDCFDVVHAHSLHAFPSLYAAQAKGRNGFVFTPHYTGGGQTVFRNLLHKPYKLLARTVLNKADRVICVSRFERNLILERFAIDQKRAVYIPNGINLKEFNNLEKEKKDGRIILTVARLEKYKGVQFLIGALQRLDDNIVLEIVGKGPYSDNLMSLAKKLEVDNRVKLYHDLERKDLLQKYANADIFVLASAYEAMPISLAEALAARIPCIVSDIPFLKEWIDNKNCFGIRYPISISELAALIDKIIGRQISGVKLLDWTDVVRRLERVYSIAFISAQKDKLH